MTAPLRALLEAPGMLELPGAHDVLSARVAEAVGCPAVYAGGAAVAAVEHGLPDVGIITGPELIDHARRTAAAVGIPVVADLDDGGGNPLTIRRLVREAERAGIAGFHLEDVDYSEGKHLLDAERRRVDPRRDKLRPAGRALDNLKAALDARENADTVIIARTDAVAVAGLDEALERAVTFADAGADLVFLPYLTPADIKTAAAAIGCGLMAIAARADDAESRRAAENDGLKVLLHPWPALLPALAVTWEIFAGLSPRAASPAAPAGGAALRTAVDLPGWTGWAEAHGLSH